MRKISSALQNFGMDFFKDENLCRAGMRRARTRDAVADPVGKAYRLALASPNFVEEEEPKQIEEPKSKKPSKSFAAGDWRLIVSEAKLSKKNSYEGLKNNGVVKSPLEEFAVAWIF